MALPGDGAACKEFDIVPVLSGDGRLRRGRHLPTNSHPRPHGPLGYGAALASARSSHRQRSHRAEIRLVFMSRRQRERSTWGLQRWRSRRRRGGALAFAPRRLRRLWRHGRRSDEPEGDCGWREALRAPRTTRRASGQRGEQGPSRRAKACHAEVPPAAERRSIPQARRRRPTGAAPPAMPCWSPRPPWSAAVIPTPSPLAPLARKSAPQRVQPRHAHRCRSSASGAAGPAPPGAHSPACRQSAITRGAAAPTQFAVVLTFSALNARVVLSSTPNSRSPAP